MYECQSKPKIRINFESPDGNIFVVLASAVNAIKRYKAAYQFKKPFWWNGSNYYPKKYIPRTYNIIKEAV